MNDFNSRDWISELVSAIDRLTAAVEKQKSTIIYTTPSGSAPVSYPAGYPYPVYPKVTYAVPGTAG